MIVMDPVKLQREIDAVEAWRKGVGAIQDHSLCEVLGAARLYHASIPKPEPLPWRVILWTTDGVKFVHTMTSKADAVAKVQYALETGYKRIEIERPPS